MNNTQKILIAIGVGVGVAYIYNRYKKGKSTTGTKATGKSTTGSFQLPEETDTANLSREEKEEFILNNVSATPQETSSGFEGVRFVWNPTLERMYPVGTIQEGEQLTFGEIYNSAEGDVVADIPSSIQNAEKALEDLTDQELELTYRITKKMSENPSIMSEEDAVKELGVKNPKIIQLVRQKLKKRLNDIKIMKKDGNWKAKWESRKEIRQNRRKKFAEKMGFQKGMFDKQTRKSCGLKPRLGKGRKASYKKCVQALANKMRSKENSQIREDVSASSISTKNTISSGRQKSFAKQVTNRKNGGMFAGKRWDGNSNQEVESMVDAGLV
tara:strand:- start:608 stop:1588 length:981 start_codon:yes stop_codon:yes gene_type:complete